MEKNDHINPMKNEAPLQNLADFDNKPLQLLDLYSTITLNTNV